MHFSDHLKELIILYEVTCLYVDAPQIRYKHDAAFLSMSFGYQLIVKIPCVNKTTVKPLRTEKG